MWAGALCVGVSRAAGALVAGRRKSPRLAALVGGLLLPLACLFTSFATQLHQTLLSYGNLKLFLVHYFYYFNFNYTFNFTISNFMKNKLFLLWAINI